MKKVEKKMLKTKLALALSTALLGVGMMGAGQAAPALTTEGLGDAALFPYYTAQGGWQTFVRLINTSNEAMAVKVRFREQANSRDVLDFMVLLSPNDMWSMWTDENAAPGADGSLAPGIRTKDTSCIVPGVDTTPLSGESFVTLDADTQLVGAAFKDRAFSGIYDDNGTVHFAGGAKARLSEGHLEVIGVASYANGSQMSNWISHNPATGRPGDCNRAINAFNNQLADADGLDATNSLAANAYLINTSMGQAGGYNPTMITDFQRASLTAEATNAQVAGSGRQPSMNSADPGAIDSSIVRGAELEQIWQGATAPNLNGVDTISTLLMRTSVINEWAAKTSTVFANRFTQWVVNFPTKNFYVDLDNDPNVLQDVSATLTDPTVGDDAVAPFIHEFDLAVAATGNDAGKSCQPYKMDIWNTEEDKASFTSPVPGYDVALCQETNVISFDAVYETQGLKPATIVTVPNVAFPVKPFLTRLGASNPKAIAGWARLSFASPTAPNGLPVDGFMMTVYDKGAAAANYVTIHDHKYEKAVPTPQGRPQ